MYQVLSKLLHLLAVGSFGEGDPSGANFYQEIPRGGNNSRSGEGQGQGQFALENVPQPLPMENFKVGRLLNVFGGKSGDPKNLLPNSSSSSSRSLHEMIHEIRGVITDRIREFRTADNAGVDPAGRNENPGALALPPAPDSTDPWYLNIKRTPMRIALLFLVVPTSIFLSVVWTFEVFAFDAVSPAFPGIFFYLMLLSWITLILNVLDAIYEYPKDSMFYEATFWMTLVTLLLPLGAIAIAWALWSFGPIHDLYLQEKTPVVLLLMFDTILVLYGILRYFNWSPSEDKKTGVVWQLSQGDVENRERFIPKYIFLVLVAMPVYIWVVYSALVLVTQYNIKFTSSLVAHLTLIFVASFALYTGVIVTISFGNLVTLPENWLASKALNWMTWLCPLLGLGVMAEISYLTPKKELQTKNNKSLLVYGQN